jgi:hypothetical protein
MGVRFLRAALLTAALATVGSTQWTPVLSAQQPGQADRVDVLIGFSSAARRC